MHLQKHPLLRSFLLLSLCVGVSILTLWQAFIPLSVSSLRTRQGVIEENGKGLYFHTGDIRSPLFKVSPFDDYIYTTSDTSSTSGRIHIFDNYHVNDTGTVHTLSQALSYYYHQLVFPTNTFDWTVTGPDGTVDYEASWKGKTITITRAVEDPKQPIKAYGNSLIMCPTCFITSGKTSYFTGVYTTNAKVLESLSTSFTPVLITDSLPPTVTSVTVRNDKGKALLGVEGDKGMRYEEPWHLLEVDSLKGTQVITLEQ